MNDIDGEELADIIEELEDELDDSDGSKAARTKAFVKISKAHEIPVGRVKTICQEFIDASKS